MSRFVSLLLAGVAACSTVPRPAPDAGPWSAEVLPARHAELDEGPRWSERASDWGHALELFVSARGVDFDTAEGFLASLSKHADGPPAKQVGHCWIRLIGPEGVLVGGHSGEYGTSRPTYREGVIERMNAGDPDPVAYLWEAMDDGVFLEGSGGLTPTFACGVPLTREEHDAVRSFVETFDPTVFALRGRACSDFLVSVAALAGLPVQNTVRVRLPRRVRYLGKTWTMWTDERYAVLDYGAPEVVEDSLRVLVEHGRARAVSLATAR